MRARARPLPMERDGATAERLRGERLRLKGALRERWGELTDDDLERAAGEREKILGAILARSGKERAEVERDLDAILNERQWTW